LGAVLRVLIAEDNQAIRDAVRGLLQKDGWSVTAAENGEIAVEMAAKINPDVVLRDFQMPVMNGLEAAARIARAHPTMPIAMYTLHENPIFQAQALASGVKKVISKSEVLTSLVQSLSEIVRPEEPSTVDTVPTYESDGDGKAKTAI
jgi:CheY-like chemotaxis protein